MDWEVMGTGAAVIAAVYAFLRNFKTDINSHIDRLDQKMDKIERDWKEESIKTENRYFEMNNRYFETNKRMDSVYRILLKKLDIKTDP